MAADKTRSPVTKTLLPFIILTSRFTVKYFFKTMSEAGLWNTRKQNPEQTNNQDNPRPQAPNSNPITYQKLNHGEKINWILWCP